MTLLRSFSKVAGGSGLWSDPSPAGEILRAEFFGVTASAATGTLEATLDALTISSAGTVTIAGAAAIPLGDLTLGETAAAAVTVTATADFGLAGLSTEGSIGAPAGADAVAQILLGSVSGIAAADAIVGSAADIALGQLSAIASSNAPATTHVDFELGIVTISATAEAAVAVTAAIEMGVLDLGSDSVVPTAAALAVALDPAIVAGSGRTVALSSGLIGLTGAPAHKSIVGRPARPKIAGRPADA